MKPQSSAASVSGLVASSGLFKGISPVMGAATLALVLGFSAFTVVDVEFAGKIFGAAGTWIAATLDWYYVVVTNFILLFAVCIILSPYGSLRLGGDDERPEFSTFSWVAMLFSAAIGVGLLFWSIAEPIQHLQYNPFTQLAGVAAGSPEAARVAMRVTLFHWGLHPWALYAFTGLAMSYFCYRKGLPLAVRSALHPLIGEHIYGWPGHAVDLLALFAIVFGTATALGLGAAQMSTGLGYLSGTDPPSFTPILIVAGIGAIATLSAVSGLHRGIKFLSEWNIRVSAVLLAFLIAAGPTAYLLVLCAGSVTGYLRHLVTMGFWLDPDPVSEWQRRWTIFYWAWWISWAPFVGMFVARISRGRTLRGFLFGVLVVPTVLCTLWLCIFGGTALDIELRGPGGLIEAVDADLTSALYRTLELMGVGLWSWLAAALATGLIASWFITSADSMILVVCTILSLGDPHPLRRYRVAGGVGLAVLTALLVLAGGVVSLQSASIAAALPFSVVMLIMAYGLVKSLAREPLSRSNSAD
jgi:choline/glycine/proline betaine transport protein